MDLHQEQCKSSKSETWNKGEYCIIIQNADESIIVSAEYTYSYYAISLDAKNIFVILHPGYRIVGEARTTGDGYYDSVIADPEDNLIEITI